MIKQGAFAATLIILAALLLSACIREVIYTTDDMYTSFPEAEILGANFYYQLNGRDVTGDDAGMISKKVIGYDEHGEPLYEEGKYTVKMRRRSPSTSPSLMSITGSFEFSEFYKITATFPDDPSITDKPHRVYACASRGSDGNADADYPTAVDLVGEAVFRNGVAIGTFEMTNEGINYLNPDPRGRPYITVFLYLYFQNVSDPNDYYEFTLDFVGGANTITPGSVVTRTEIYRDGDTDTSFTLETIDTGETETIQDIETGQYINQSVIVPILANYNHRFNSDKLSSGVFRTDANAIPVIDTTTMHIDLQVPDEYTGRQIEFELRNVGFYNGSTTNRITRTLIQSGIVLAGTSGGSQTGVIEEITVPGNPPSYYYKVRAQTARYNNLFGNTTGTGVRLVIPGIADTFNDVDRFTCTIYLPDQFGWNN